MGQYRTYEGFDDPIASDGDIGFVGMNQWLLPNQLQPGEVRLSSNGRIDGCWQPRRGIELRSGALSNSANPLVLPFWCAEFGQEPSEFVVRTTAEGDPNGSPGGIGYQFIGDNMPEINGEIFAPTGNTVEGYPQYFFYDSVNNANYFLERDSINDSWVIIFQDPITLFSLIYFISNPTTGPYYDPEDATSWTDLISFGTITAVNQVAVGAPVGGITGAFLWQWCRVGNSAPYDWYVWNGTSWDLIDPTTVTYSAERDGETVTVTATGFGHGMSPIGDGVENLDAYIQLDDFETDGKTVDINGLHLATWLDYETFEFTIDDAPAGTESYDGGDLTIEINNGAVSFMYGSCGFSDPSNELEESAILATNVDAKKVNLNTFAVESLPYPADIVITENVELIQAFDKVFIFRDGQRSLEWIPGGRVITAAALASNVVTVTVKNHGLTTGDVVTISGLTFTGTDPNDEHTVTFATVDTFTFPLTSANETYGVTNGKMVAKGFTKVLGGPYTAAQSFTIQSSAVSVTDGLLTATVTGNTTIKPGDFVYIHYTAIASLEHLEGKQYQVVSANATTITFFVPAGDFTAGGSSAFEFGGRFSVGGGFIHMPAPPWAVYFQRRLWCPHWHEPNGTVGSPTYRDRQARDEIVASDILDSDTFDQIYSQFRVTAGIADYTVGMQPFYDDALMILNRNSLHVVTGTQGGLEDTVVKELTREIGCLARKSIVTKGNVVFFLSDNGVYGVEFLNDYNLRGTEEPLSKNIQPFIDRINQDLAENAVGVFFNNRYWLAVPLDSTRGEGDAKGNNAILVFNILNKAWESVDTYDVPDFDITNFIIGQTGKRNRLYIVNDSGGLHEVDSREQPIDVYSTNVIGGSSQSNVNYELISRGYMLGGTNYDRKKFHRAQVQLQSGVDASNVDFFFSSEDPDSEKQFITSANNLIGEDLPGNEAGTFRMRLGNPRGLYGSLTISSTTIGSSPVGRPKVNSITVDGSITNRSTISQT